MHHANHYYGHSHVLARYCGLDGRDPPRIHGWIGDVRISCRALSAREFMAPIA